MEEEKKHHPFRMPSVVSNSVPLSGSRSGPSLSSFEPELQLAALLLFFLAKKREKKTKTNATFMLAPPHPALSSCSPRLTGSGAPTAFQHNLNLPKSDRRNWIM